jgi:maleate isomerase
MYGWRSRIGLIVPSGNIVMENEFYKILSKIDGVSVHTTRILLESGSLEDLLKMKEGLLRAARELESARVSIIVYGCTSGSFAKGLDFDKEIIKEIEEETHIKATTTSTAVVEALKRLKVKNIAVGTPYSDDVNEKEKEFLRANGFSVTTIVGLNIIPIFNQGLQEPYVAYNLGKRIDSNKAECIFISCTDIRAVEIIDSLERRLRKPVISSNLATLWYVLKLEQLNLSLKGYGKLLEEY